MWKEAINFLAQLKKKNKQTQKKNQYFNVHDRMLKKLNLTQFSWRDLFAGDDSIK